MRDPQPRRRAFRLLTVLLLALLLPGLSGCLDGPAPPLTPSPSPRLREERGATAGPAPRAADPTPRMSEARDATPAPPSPTTAPAGLVARWPTLGPPPTPVAPRPPPQVPVLAYHLINVPEGGEYNVSAAEFAAQMAWLHANAYQAITPAQLVAAIDRGAPLPPRPVLITFDDNQYTPYEHAVPVLKQYGFTATFFIMTVSIGKDGYLSAAQIQELAAAGFTIGSHTWDHRVLIEQPNGELERQLKLSGADLAAILGHPPEYFAYPTGLYNERVVAALKAHGYKGAFGLHNPDDPLVDPAFMIRRQIIAGGWTVEDFAHNLQWMAPDTP